MHHENIRCQICKFVMSREGGRDSFYLSYVFVSLTFISKTIENFTWSKCFILESKLTVLSSSKISLSLTPLCKTQWLRNYEIRTLERIQNYATFNISGLHFCQTLKSHTSKTILDINTISRDCHSWYHSATSWWRQLFSDPFHLFFVGKSSCPNFILKNQLNLSNLFYLYYRFQVSFRIFQTIVY